MPQIMKRDEQQVRIGALAAAAEEGSKPRQPSHFVSPSAQAPAALHISAVQPQPRLSACDSCFCSILLPVKGVVLPAVQASVPSCLTEQVPSFGWCAA